MLKINYFQFILNLHQKIYKQNKPLKYREMENHKKYIGSDFKAITIEERIFLANVELLNLLEAIRYELWKMNEK